MPANLEAELDLNELINQANELGLFNLGTHANDLLVGIENRTNIKFTIEFWPDVRSGKTQGDITRSGATQDRDDEGKRHLVQLPDPSVIEPNSNWLLFAERAHIANAKLFLNLIPAWVEKGNSAVGLYAGSRNGGRAEAHYKEKVGKIGENPKSLDGFRKVTGMEVFTIPRKRWGSGQDVKFTVQVNSGNKKEPAEVLFFIANS